MKNGTDGGHVYIILTTGEEGDGLVSIYIPIQRGSGGGFPARTIENCIAISAPGTCFSVCRTLYAILLTSLALFAFLFQPIFLRHKDIARVASTAQATGGFNTDSV